MDILQLGAIGELVGGIAVLVTLIYLSLQVRQSNHQVSAQAVKEAVTEFVGAFAAVTSDEQAAKNFRAGMNYFTQLDPNQQSIFHSKMQTLANGYYQVWTLHQHRMVVDEDLFSRCENLYLTILRAPDGHHWWNAWKHLPPQPWVAELDRLVNNPNSDVTPANQDLSWFRDEKAN